MPEFRARDKTLAEFFETQTVSLDVSGELEKQNRTVVVCTDIRRLVNQLLMERELDSETATLKIGIDNGGGFLKVTLNVMPYNSILCPSRYALHLKMEA